MQVDISPFGDCQFEALLSSVTGRLTRNWKQASTAADLRILATDYLDEHRDAPSSGGGGEGAKFSTVSQDIVAASCGSVGWAGYRHLDFDTYLDAMRQPGGVCLAV